MVFIHPQRHNVCERSCMRILQLTHPALPQSVFRESLIVVVWQRAPFLWYSLASQRTGQLGSCFMSTKQCGITGNALHTWLFSMFKYKEHFVLKILCGRVFLSKYVSLKYIIHVWIQVFYTDICFSNFYGMLLYHGIKSKRKLMSIGYMLTWRGICGFVEETT